MDKSIIRTNNDKELVAAFVKSPKLYVMQEKCSGEFFVDKSCGQSTLWCAPTAEDIAFVIGTAYRDLKDSLDVYIVERKNVMSFLAQSPTTRVGFVYGSDLEAKPVKPPFMGSLNRRAILEEIQNVSLEDREGFDFRPELAKKDLEGLSLFGILTANYKKFEHWDTLVNSEYIYSTSPKTSLEYLRWVRDGELLDEMWRNRKNNISDMANLFKSVGEIIQGLERDGLAGLVVYNKGSSVMLNIDDLLAIQGCASDAAVIRYVKDLSMRHSEWFWEDVTDILCALANASCGFNIHTDEGSAICSLVAYCVVGKIILNNNESLDSIYKNLLASVKNENIPLLLKNIIMCAEFVAAHDTTISWNIKKRIREVYRQYLERDDISINELTIMPLSEGPVIYEATHHLLRMGFTQKTANVLKSAFKHDGRSDGEITRYIDYAADNNPALLDEWAASLSSLTIRENNLVRVGSFTIRDIYPMVREAHPDWNAAHVLLQAYMNMIDMSRESPKMCLAIPKKYCYYGIGTLEPVKQPVQSGRTFKVMQCSRYMGNMPHDVKGDDDICNYIMKNDIRFSFKVLDMKRAERSVQVTMMNQYNLDESQIKRLFAYLYQYPDILMEYGKVTMGIKPTNPIEVEGYTASELFATTRLERLGAYCYLVYLRNHPKEAIKELNDGLPLL